MDPGSLPRQGKNSLSLHDVVLCVICRFECVSRQRESCMSRHAQIESTLPRQGTFRLLRHVVQSPVLCIFYPGLRCYDLGMFGVVPRVDS